VSKLKKKGTSMIFKDGKATVELADGSRVLSAIKSRKMYIVELDKMPPKTLTVQSNRKSASFDI